MESETVTKTNATNLEDGRFNEPLINLLNSYQDLQKHLLNMLQDMTHSNEYNSLNREIKIYDRKMWLADWLLQIEKVALLINSQEYETATAKMTSTDAN